MSESAKYLKSVLTSRKATTVEKISAAKGLETIERRAGDQSVGSLIRMDLVEIDAEIAAVKAMLADKVPTKNT